MNPRRLYQRALSTSAPTAREFSFPHSGLPDGLVLPLRPYRFRDRSRGGLHHRAPQSSRGHLGAAIGRPPGSRHRLHGAHYRSALPHRCSRFCPVGFHRRPCWLGGRPALASTSRFLTHSGYAPHRNTGHPYFRRRHSTLPRAIEHPPSRATERPTRRADQRNHRLSLPTAAQPFGRIADL